MLYYNGEKILNMKDRNGDTPEIIIVDGNRGTGKTTYFDTWLFENWKKTGEQFLILNRNKYEIASSAPSFFGKVLGLDSTKYVIDEKSKKSGIYHEIKVNDKVCCFSTAINCADKIKKCAEAFKNVSYILIDEFQNEYDDYAYREVIKFQSIYNSIARGENQIHRTVKVIMLSNSVDIHNPYYDALGLSEKLLKSNMGYFRGNGFVLEHNYNESVAEILKMTPFNRAFSGTNYANFLSEKNVYLKNTDNLIGDLDLGNKKYWFTLVYQDLQYGIYKSPEQIAITTKVDTNYKDVYVITKSDYDIDTTRIPQKYYNKLSNYFDNGKIVCENIKCQNLIMDIM